MPIDKEYQNFFEKYKTDVLGLHELSLHNFWNSEDTLSFKKECTNLVNYLKIWFRMVQQFLAVLINGGRRQISGPIFEFWHI